MKTHKQSDKTIWVIRAGTSYEKSAAHEIFLQEGLLVLGAQNMGDLRKLPKDRDSFYAAYGHAHPDDGNVAIGGIGGKFFRFIYEIKPGDLVLYPCRVDKLVYVGIAVGLYSYATKAYPDFPHNRKVRWLGSFPKKTLSLGAFRELGAARTLFRLKTHTAEILQLVPRLDPVDPSERRKQRKRNGRLVS